jgi:hypothetical protein
MIQAPGVEPLMMRLVFYHYATVWHNNIQHNGTQHYAHFCDTQHYVMLSVAFFIFMLSASVLFIILGF